MGTTSLVIWSHQSGDKTIHRDSMLEMLKKRKAPPYGPSFRIIEERIQWQGDRVVIPVGFDGSDKGMTPHAATFVWNMRLNTLSLEGLK